MATAVTKFEEAKLPTFFRAPADSSTNALAALAPTTYPYLSIKGKRFALVRNKEETPIMRVDDDETPANAIEVVLVNTAPTFSKVFYAAGYTEGSKDKPTCYSNDGVAPASDAADKQAAKCAACEHNAWGTGNNGKGKACSDSLRLALSFPDSINDPFLLRVPPASLKAVTEYAAFLSRKGAPMEGLVTKIKFDSEEATPKLQFSALRYLTKEQYDEVMEVAKAGITQQIIGTNAVARLNNSTPALPPAEEKGSPEAEDEAPAKSPVKPPAKPVKGAKAPEKAVETRAPEKKAGNTTVSALAAKLKESMKSAATDD
jgi:hypothetical protein